MKKLSLTAAAITVSALGVIGVSALPASAQTEDSSATAEEVKVDSVSEGHARGPGGDRGKGDGMREALEEYGLELPELPDREAMQDMSEDERKSVMEEFRATMEQWRETNADILDEIQGDRPEPAEGERPERQESEEEGGGEHVRGHRPERGASQTDES